MKDVGGATHTHTHTNSHTYLTLGQEMVVLIRKHARTKERPVCIFACGIIILCCERLIEQEFGHGLNKAFNGSIWGLTRSTVPCLCVFVCVYRTLELRAHVCVH